VLASLEALEDAPGMTPFHVSAVTAVSTFTLGSIGFAPSIRTAARIPGLAVSEVPRCATAVSV
jgi:hypothetical protein